MQPWCGGCVARDVSQELLIFWNVVYFFSLPFRRKGEHELLIWARIHGTNHEYNSYRKGALDASWLTSSLLSWSLVADVQARLHCPSTDHHAFCSALATLATRIDTHLLSSSSGYSRVIRRPWSNTLWSVSISTRHSAFSVTVERFSAFLSTPIKLSNHIAEQTPLKLLIQPAMNIKSANGV
jgi:hypothetical protein